MTCSVVYARILWTPLSWDYINTVNCYELIVNNLNLNKLDNISSILMFKVIYNCKKPCNWIAVCIRYMGNP